MRHCQTRFKNFYCQKKRDIIKIKKKITNDDDNDHVIDEVLLFILSVILQKTRDRKEVFDTDRMCLHFKNVHDIL